MAENELLHRYAPHTADTRQLHLGPGGDEHRRRIRGVVGIREHAADGRNVAHPRARDDLERPRQAGPADAYLGL